MVRSQGSDRRRKPGPHHLLRHALLIFCSFVSFARILRSFTCRRVYGGYLNLIGSLWRPWRVRFVLRWQSLFKGHGAAAGPGCDDARRGFGGFECPQEALPDSSRMGVTGKSSRFRARPAWTSIERGLGFLHHHRAPCRSGSRPRPTLDWGECRRSPPRCVLFHPRRSYIFQPPPPFFAFSFFSGFFAASFGTVSVGLLAALGPTLIRRPSLSSVKATGGGRVGGWGGWGVGGGGGGGADTRETNLRVRVLSA